MSPGTEFRISWRREGWSGATKTKTRKFTSESAARRFLRKLTGDERPDLSDLSLLRVESRPVGPWQEVAR